MSAGVSAAWLMGFLMLKGLLAEELVLSINTKKPIAITGDKFLSFTLDPTYILTSNIITENPEKSINMAKALAPAYVRIAGPRSNSYTFARAHATQEEDPSFIFTETDWNILNGWAASAGLDVVASVAPQQHSEAGGGAARDIGWDSRNILDLISFSDHMGYNVSWQLGYECQTRCDISGGDLGKDVMRLRNMLEAFPRFARSIVVGPDVVTFKTKLQQLYLQEYLNSGAGGLSAITWHPEFASITVDPAGVSMHHDNLALDRDALYRVIGRHMAKKPLWLAESKPEECKKQFLGALVWTRRLGNSAKLGAQVVMRQPQESNLFEPTPDFWISVLHKILVGREVLDTKIATGNRTHLHFYCQCTRPSSRYEKGSLTVFGINLTPTKLAVSLKGVKIKTLHKYILLPGFDAENRMFSETILLNNEPLKLANGKDMPEIKPVIATSGKGLSMKLPSGGIGFWVIPDMKLKSCESQDSDSVDKMLLKKLSKRLEEYSSEEDTTSEDWAKEITDNSEERRPFIQSSRKRKRDRPSIADDDATRRFRKVDAKRDLERLEKLLKWRENLEERRISLRGKPAHIGFQDKSYEINGDSESEETIRAKLEMYKRRLKEYETRKNVIKSRDKSLVDGDLWDSARIEEAMRLITKVENAMKSLEETADSLNPGNDVATGLNGTPEEHFLDELLKTRKIKRTIPERVEEQLRGIYEMLAEEKERRQRMYEGNDEDVLGDSLLRRRRQVGKFGDDPLGLRKPSILPRKRNSAGDLKERLEKYRKKGEKKEGGPVFFDPENPSSNENNFYGFAKQKPIPGFPQGDVYVATAKSSEDKKNDADQVSEDYLPEQHRRNTKNAKTAKVMAEMEQPWVEEEGSVIGDIPKEFLENIPADFPRIQKNYGNYGELWEAQAMTDPRVIRQTGRIDDGKAVQETRDNQAADDLPQNVNAASKVVNVRQRRDIGYMETLLDKEMEFQDENNLKDCQCRVIRGIRDRKPDVFSRIAEEKHKLEGRLIDAKKKILGRTRPRRDASEEYEYEEDPEHDQHAEQEPEGDVEDEGESLELTRHNRQVDQSPIPSANPSIEPKQFFRSPDTTNRTPRSSAKSPDAPPTLGFSDPAALGQTGSLHNGKGASLVPYSQVAQVPPTKFSLPHPIAQTEAVTFTPEEPEKNDAVATEKSQSLKVAPRVTGDSKASAKIPRSPKKIPKVRTSPLDVTKLREARLAAKPQVLLTKETDTKRILKISETLKVQEEAAKLRELHRKRLEELEKLKDKLKVKRSKLQEALAEEMEKLSDGKAKTVKREIMQLLREEQELQSIVDKGKSDYAMLYPAKIQEGGLEDAPEVHSTETESYPRDTQSSVEPSVDSYESIIEGLDEIPSDSTEASDELVPDMKSQNDGRDPQEKLMKPDQTKKSRFICMQDSSESDERLLNLRNSGQHQNPRYARLARKVATIERPEALEIDGPLDPNKYELMMLVPIKNQREKRDLTPIRRKPSDNEIWGSAFRWKPINDEDDGNDLDVFGTKHMFRMRPEAAYPPADLQEDPLSSLVEGAIPKIEEVVTNSLGKAQNVTGSIEKLINEFEDTRAEAENLDEKTEFKMAVKNNPDGLMTHDFFYDTIEGVKTFFDFLGGMSHILFTN